MERVLTSDEKIRRAEEIYQRRLQNRRTGQTRVNVSTNRNALSQGKKMFLQIVVCLLIYLFFYTIQHNDMIFSEEFLQKVKEFLSYDMNVTKVYMDIQNFFSSQEKQQSQDIIPASQEEETQEEIILPVPEEEAILSMAEETSSISQTQTDADLIKEKYSFIKRLEGVITSRFGIRESTSSIVSPFHTGIDIAADTGTVYYAAMEGTVVEASSEGAYGIHIKIVQDDVATLYAHSNTIYVKEGDHINQGQELGEVGETGNATGPHLHFEIRKEERFVDPDDILDF